MFGNVVIINVCKERYNFKAIMIQVYESTWVFCLNKNEQKITASLSWTTFIDDEVIWNSFQINDDYLFIGWLNCDYYYFNIMPSDETF